MPAEKQVETHPGSSETSQQQFMTLPGGKPVNPWLVLVSLVIGLFMALLDATIVNIAFTAIGSELHSDATTTSWVLNSYSLVFAVLLVSSGRLADQFGRKRIFMIGMVFFSLGSLLCATAPSIEWLIAFRAIQAIGASTLNPISLAIITVVFPPQKRGAAIGMWGALTGLAMGIGPIVGGFLVQTFEWRSIFFVNIPFCIVGLLLVWRNVPENFDRNASKSIDYMGTILMSIGLFCLVLAIMNGNDWGWSSIGIIALFGGSIAAFFVFFFTELKQEHPIIDFKLFKIRSFMASNLAMMLFGIGIQAALLILVFYYIMQKGDTQLEAAYALLPMPVAGFLVSGVFGAFSRKADLRLVGMAGIFMSGFGLLLLSQISTQTAYLDVAWRSIFVGMGLGLSFMTYSTIVLSEVPHAKVGVASGVFNTFRQIGFALGVAIMISFFTGQMKDNMTTASNNAVAMVNAVPGMPDSVKTMIGTQLKKMGAQSNNMGERGGSSNQQMDLTAMLSKMPGGEEYKDQMNTLNTQIGNEMQNALNKSFTTTWLLGGFVLLLGLIPAFFARHRHRVEAEPAFAKQQIE